MTDGQIPFAFWNSLATDISIFSWLAGLLICLVYFVRLLLVSDLKNKYDFIIKHEINWLWAASLLLIFGACFYANTGITEITRMWIFVRAFMTIALGLMVALVVQNMLKFYYPFYIEKRLKKLRYKPRISPSGNKMILMTESDEDAYLDEGMQAEENLFSVDYDVWKDETTGYIKVEKYSGHLHALECPECNYQTFKINQEEVLKTATPEQDGTLEKHYRCSYCGYRSKKTVHLKFSYKPDAHG
jgi:hypothetical protein